MNPALALRLIIDPTLALLAELGVKSDGRARIMLLAIALQESGLKYRRQIVGPARGFWQFELGGGVAGVLKHPASAQLIRILCAALVVPASSVGVHAALEQNDPLACACARLLLLTDPSALPTEANAGWAYYLRNWRPGKPHPETWAGHWQTALQAVGDTR